MRCNEHRCVSVHGSHGGSLFAGFSDEYGCVGVENDSSGCLLVALLFETSELDELLRLRALREYLLVLDLLDIFLFLDRGVIVLKQEVFFI